MQITWIVIILMFGNMGQQASSSEPAPICRLETKCEEYGHPEYSKRFFNVSETQLSIDSNIRQLVLKCFTEPGSLDVSSLPAYDARRVFDEVYIQGCALGAASVADVLRALNASVELKLELEHVREPLRAAHLAGLRLRKLNLGTMAPFRTKLDDDFFTAFGNDSNLVSLWTSGVEYEAPPSGLEKWTFTNASIKRLPRGVLATLKELYLIEPLLCDLSALEEAVALQNLSVMAAVAGPLPRLPALRTLWVQGWRGLDAAPLPCAQLESLGLVGAPLRPAADWLARCGRLRALLLQAPLLQDPRQALPSQLLSGASALAELTIRGARLTSAQLPVDLLNNNTELTKLDLSHNELTTVPSPLFFRRLEKLSELDLSRNRLAAPAEWFPALPALRKLRLDHNPLGDSCPEQGTDRVKAPQYSWLQQLEALTTLSLRNTSSARVCEDWLTRMPRLGRLDLAHNAVTRLEYRTLHPLRLQRSVILLQGNNVSEIAYSQEDFERVGSELADQPPTLIMLDSSAKLRCDCDMYWFALALQRFPAHVLVSDLACADGRALRARAPAALACAVPCGAGCRCRAVPARAQLEARCERLPAAAPPAYHEVQNLSLADTGLERAPAADALPRALRTLDLRRGALRGERLGALLAARPALAVLLAGNPLDCCAPAVRDALLQYRDRVLDFESLECADGSRPGACGAGGAAGGAGSGAAALLLLLALPALAAAAALAALAHPKSRAKLKVILHMLGVRGAGARGAWKYDAFVSFAEADAGWVARRLVPALEGGRRPRRLCLHYRDWAVGELIPQQIARSVAESRRTVLVVSDAFARSAWARAEFEAAAAAAAADGRPAPLAVLRSAPSAAALAAAPALAHFLRAATYLAADDPRFRQRLRAALPVSSAPDGQ